MPTRVFLCWSGTRSQKLAQALKDWIPKAMGNGVEGSMSTQIEKGTEWFDELRRALDTADCGVLCLTPEAIESPWIHFEAGLLVRALSQTTNSDEGETRANRVFPLLYGVAPGTLSGPLSAYQSTVATDFDDVLRLLQSIDQFVPQDERARAEPLRRTCRSHWSGFQKALRTIEPVAVKEVVSNFEELFQRKTFQEPMHDCLSQNWLDRYNGARDTQKILKGHQATVRQACRPSLADMFDGLVAALDGYTMALSKLLGKGESAIDPATGQLVFDNPGIAVASERHRKNARGLVARIADAQRAPVLEEVYRFEIAETFEEKKRLVHRKIDEWKKSWKDTDESRRLAAQDLVKRCDNSEWELERILYYAWREDQTDLDFRAELSAVRRELEKANARRESLSLMPLSYSLGPVETAASPTADRTAVEEFGRLNEDIRTLIAQTDSDKGRQVRASLSRIETKIRAGESKQIAAGK